MQQWIGLVLNIYDQYSFSYKCWNFCANWLIWLEVIKERHKGVFFSEHSVYYKIYSLDITVGENDFLLLLSEKKCI